MAGHKMVEVKRPLHQAGKQFHVRLDDELADKLKLLASVNNTGISATIRDAIEAYIKTFHLDEKFQQRAQERIATMKKLLKS
jgi:predicted transcriptional regulator